MHASRITFTSIALLSLLTLAACGQKGALYIPKDEAAPKASTEQPSATQKTDKKKKAASS